MEARAHDLFAEAAQRMRLHAARPLPFEPEFRTLGQVPLDVHAVAVDGSQAVLADTGAIWVVAVRAAATPWPSATTAPAHPTLHVASPDEGPQQVASAYEATGLEAPRVRGADGYAEAWRALAELETTVEALASMGPDDLLLIDGALERLGDARAQAMADRILEAAARGQVPVAAVAKRSRLHRDGRALVPALHRIGPAGRWAVAVPEYRLAHVVRLHDAAPFAFRVDVSHPEVLERLPALCRDAVYLGYPYPLAAAHNRVAITATEAYGLRDRLEDAVRGVGGAEAAALLADFHEVLDRNVP